MTDRELFCEFEALLSQLDVELRVERGQFEGGLCSLGDRRVFLLNQNTSLPARLRVLGEALASMDLSSLFLLPAVRERIPSGPVRSS